MLVLNQKQKSECGAPSRRCERRARSMTLYLVAMLGATMALIGTASSPSFAHEPVHTPGQECLPGSQGPIAPYERFNRGTDAPLLITPDCVDPRYNTPVIDSIAIATTPAGTTHTVVLGRFLDSTPGPVPRVGI